MKNHEKLRLLDKSHVPSRNSRHQNTFSIMENLENHSKFWNEKTSGRKTAKIWEGGYF